MQRIDVLIDKLVDQQQQQASVDQMLVTVQLLYKEMLHQQQRQAATSGAKVAVVMANAINPAIPQEPKNESAPAVYEPSPYEPKPIAEVAPPPPPPPPPVIAEPIKEEPAEKEPEPKKEIYEPKPEIKPEAKPYEIGHPPYDPVAQMPTLIQHQPKKEVHEQLVVDNTASLNDKLKQEKTELGQVLKESPIKDLRKAIGINDKFLFVNELFRGDEAAYERSIKTINNFHILPEAEYWINRELKVKLGWNDGKDIVQHFYQLVRRRFS